MLHSIYPGRAYARPYLNANDDIAYQPLTGASTNFYELYRSVPQSWNPVGEKQRRKAKEVAKELDYALQQTPAYKRLKRMRQSSRAVSAGTGAFMFAAMVAVTLIFATTKSEKVNGRSLWPQQPTEWPTYMLLAAALVSSLTAIGVMLMFCCCYERASKSWKLILLLNAVEVIYWLVVAIVYKKEQRLADLWGWSCSDIAAELQDGGSSVAMDSLCTLQTVSWWVSVAETILKVTVLVFTVWLVKKLKKETEDLKIRIVDTVGGSLSDGINNFLI